MGVQRKEEPFENKIKIPVDEPCKTKESEKEEIITNVAYPEDDKSAKSDTKEREIEEKKCGDTEYLTKCDSSELENNNTVDEDTIRLSPLSNLTQVERISSKENEAVIENSITEQNLISSESQNSNERKETLDDSSTKVSRDDEMRIG